MSSTDQTPRGLHLHPEEPSFAPFVARPVADVADDVVALGRERAGGRAGPGVVAVDGRGGAGTTTTAGVFAAALGRAGVRVAIVHTDDIARWEPYFAWGHLLRSLVLEPLRDVAREGSGAGSGAGAYLLRVRPPAWEQRDREGAIEVPAGTDLVLVEGTGAAQREVADLLDAVVWVQADAEEAQRRGIERDVIEATNGDLAQATAFWHDWQATEMPFLAEDRPWERANLVLCGTPTQAGLDLTADELAVGAAGALGAPRSECPQPDSNRQPAD